MTSVSADILLKGRELAQSRYRARGRVEDALVIDTFGAGRRSCAASPPPATVAFTWASAGRPLSTLDEAGLHAGELGEAQRWWPASATFDAASCEVVAQEGSTGHGWKSRRNG